MKNLNFLVAAYLAIWAVFCVFLFSVAQRLGKLQSEVRKWKASAAQLPRASSEEKIPTAR